MLYSWRGARKALPNGRDLIHHNLIVPILLRIQPVQKFYINVGFETGILLASNRFEERGFSMNIRAAAGFSYQIVPDLAINLHCSYAISPSNTIQITDEQGNPISSPAYERMLVASLGVNYTFKSWDKKTDKGYN